MRVQIMTLIVACSLYMDVANGQVYKCKDPSGNISYRDRPCKDAGNSESSDIDARISVIDREGARELSRQRANQSSRGTSTQNIRQSEEYSSALASQRRQGEQMLRETERLSKNASKRNDASLRSRESAYIRHLMTSAKILMNSRKSSPGGVSALRESNKIALNASHLTAASSRRPMLNEASRLQQSAGMQLGAPIEVASPRQGRPSPSTSPNAVPAPTSPQPSVITNCDSAGCWDNLGNRYNKGAGSTYFPTSGGSCQLVGGMMQCP